MTDVPMNGDCTKKGDNLVEKILSQNTGSKELDDTTVADDTSSAAGNTKRSRG